MKKIYKQAQALALTNGEKYHVACILWRRNKPVYIGVNSSKKDERFIRRVSDGSLIDTLHAEMDALRFAQHGDRLEVLRFLKDGEITMARPCRFCQKYISKSGVEKVLYTDWEGTWRLL